MKMWSKGFVPVCVVLAFLIVGCVGGVAAAQKVQFRNGLTLFDAHNKKVGKVIAIEGGVPLVAFEINRDLVVLRVLPERFIGEAGPLYFEDDKCSGVPLLRTPEIQPGLIPDDVAISLPGNTVYIPDSLDVPRTVIFRSVQDHMQCLTDQSGFAILVVRAVPLINLDTVFTPPFEVG